MGLRGSSPTPTAVLQSRGSWRAKTRSGEPKPLAGPVEPVFKLTARAQTYFDRACEWASAMSVLSRSDAHTLTRYAVLLDRWETLAGDKRSGGKSMFNLHAVLLTIEREFGLTPSARARLVQTGISPPGDKADDFFAKIKRA